MNDSKLSETAVDRNNPDASIQVKLPEISEGVAFIQSYGVIRVTGEDALNFLHQQLTHDFLHLDLNQARFCSFCNAKGRIQASFIAFKTSQTEVLMFCSKDLIAQTVKRLSMFVLRAKVKISDASAEYFLYGVIGQTTNQPLIDQPKASPWSLRTVQSDDGPQYWCSLYPAQGLQRQLCLSMHEIKINESSIIQESEWTFSDIMSGVCLIGQTCFEAFVPQMINYESVDGVHFQKGCYPGQEVVARSQFRGTIKRRGFLLTCPSALHEGEELFVDSDPDQPCGLIVRCVEKEGIYFAFASLTLQSVDPSSSPQISTKAVQHSSIIKILELPYPLKEDI